MRYPPRSVPQALPSAGGIFFLCQLQKMLHVKCFISIIRHFLFPHNLLFPQHFRQRFMRSWKQSHCIRQIQRHRLQLNRLISATHITDCPGHAYCHRFRVCVCLHRMTSTFHYVFTSFLCPFHYKKNFTQLATCYAIFRTKRW